MFNALLTKFQGFFSKSFWFGKFLPVALVALVHLALIESTQPDLLPIEAWVDAGIGEQTIEITLLLSVFVVIAYILGPFIPFFSEVLEGRVFPHEIQKELRDRRLPAWRKTEARVTATVNDFAYFEDLHEVRQEEIKNFHRERKNRAPVAGVPPFDADLIKAAIDAVDAMDREMDTTSLPRHDTIENALGKLVAAQNSCSSAAPVEALLHLNDARGRFMDLVKQAFSEAVYRLGTAEKFSFLRVDLTPTRVGDARRSVEKYVQDTYGISDFDYIWIRVQMVLPTADAAFYQGLEDAQSQVNFSVLTLFLSLTIPAVWLPVFLYYGTSLWLYAVIAVLTPVTVLFLFELVVQSHAVFGQAVKATIDKYRLKVLTEVEHQPRPTTLAAERLLWEGLLLASGSDNRYDLVLQGEKKQ